MLLVLIPSQMFYTGRSASVMILSATDGANSPVNMIGAEEGDNEVKNMDGNSGECGCVCLLKESLFPSKKTAFASRQWSARIAHFGDRDIMQSTVVPTTTKLYITGD